MKDKENLVNLVKKSLSDRVVTVKFTKVSTGETRTMNCTTKPELLPTESLNENGKVKAPRKPNPDVQAVYDVDKQGWRSFRWDSLIEAAVGEDMLIQF